MQTSKFIENSLLRLLQRTDCRASGFLVLYSLACGLSAFALSATINSAIDHGLFFDASLLHDKELRYFIANQVHETTIGIFVHFFVLELSFICCLSLIAALAKRQVMEKRGFAFVFISFLVFETLAVPLYILWWGRLNWSEADTLATFSAMTIPAPCAFLYTFHLAVVFLIFRYRKFDAWNNLPLWSIFAPTASYVISGIAMIPICAILNSGLR